MVLIVSTGSVVAEKNATDEVEPTGIPGVPDAYINIFPDQYSYSIDESGTVTVNVDNEPGIYVAYTSYYLRIPDGVQYNGILDGPEPYAVHYLDEGESQTVPKLGSVEGPCTLLMWQAIHLSGYQKEIVVDVSYPNGGSFEFKSEDACQDAIEGITDRSEDSFTVSVS